MSIKEVDTGYKPRSVQIELHKNIRRFSAIAMHRRGGKSIMGINHAIDAGIKCRFPNPQYGWISPLLSQSKRNIWDSLKRFTKGFPEISVNENELRVDIWRADNDRVRIQLFGAENPDSLNGYYMDGAILDEAQDHDEKFFGKTVFPMLTDRMGWVLFLGTARGRTYFWKLRQRYKEKMLAGDQDYFSAELKASETGLITPADLEIARAEMGEELYQQEFELSVDSPNKGSYYGDYIAQAEKDVPSRVTSVPYDPSLTVDLAFDLGIDDTTAIWVYQQLGREIRLIHFLEDSGLGIPQWAGKLRMLPYNYGTAILPHDAAARELGTGKTREEVFRSLGFQTKIVPRQSIADGIQAARNIMPRCWFDKSKCEHGLNALREYQRVWDDKEKVFLSHPKHDWSSHGADAFRTLAMGMRESRVDLRTLPREAECDWDVFR